jgi:hypothetical protein
LHVCDVDEPALAVLGKTDAAVMGFDFPTGGCLLMDGPAALSGLLLGVNRTKSPRARIDEIDPTRTLAAEGHELPDVPSRTLAYLRSLIPMS